MRHGLLRRKSTVPETRYLRFLADMGISSRVVSWLKDKGHDIVHLRDEGLQSLPDRDIFKKASSENRIILTFDLDFGEIVALSQESPVSVFIFRLHNTTTPFVIKRLEQVLIAYISSPRQNNTVKNKTPCTLCLLPCAVYLPCRP